MATIVFVPGAWHNCDAFIDVMTKVEAKGHHCVPAPLKTNGAKPALKNNEADVERIRNIVRPLVEEGKDVVMVFHSYGSLPGCDALPDLDKKSRSERGQNGGVIGLVYLAAFLLPAGPSVMDALGGKDLEWFRPDKETGAVGCDNAREIFYNGLKDSEAQYWVDRLVSFSYGAFFSATRYAAWQHIPSTYVMCTNDKALLPQVQEAMLGAAGDKFKIFQLNSGHSPFLSHPDFCVDVLLEAAKS